MNINLGELKLAKEIIEKRLAHVRKTLSFYPNQNPELSEEVAELQRLRNKAHALLLEQSILFVKKKKLKWKTKTDDDEY